MSHTDIIVPFIPDEIITLFKKDYPYIQELLEYKRDETLAFLKSQRAIAFYNGSLGLNVKSDVKSWGHFIEYSRNYTRKVVQEGLQKYQFEEKDLDDKKKQFNLLDMEILGPTIEQISNEINNRYLKKFPSWPTSGAQEDYIEVSIKQRFEFNKLLFFWLCRGTIFVKDTRYDPPKNGYPYRLEFSGKPELQISYFDLNQIRLCNEMVNKNKKLIKEKIDEIYQKLIEQNLLNLLNNFYFGDI